ncbi:hypothetical protein DOTSEDRAFT_81690 [Dothistroma septosporum NZE10]|uniref:Uncharacterized protein n=1 Tax=Dothistroma septosporum (strain NZE10 / CBS 128990) TaxID=675120 RepID=N1PFF7_DOTSN|nr:hypothetical protein DOTSEDRAFT_81690 [Dothistroma septosporum NZE10]
MHAVGAGSYAAVAFRHSSRSPADSSAYLGGSETSIVITVPARIARSLSVSPTRASHALPCLRGSAAHSIADRVEIVYLPNPKDDSEDSERLSLPESAWSGAGCNALGRYCMRIIVLLSDASPLESSMTTSIGIPYVVLGSSLERAMKSSSDVSFFGSLPLPSRYLVKDRPVRTCAWSSRRAEFPVENFAAALSDVGLFSIKVLDGITERLGGAELAGDRLPSTETEREYRCSERLGLLDCATARSGRPDVDIVAFKIELNHVADAMIDIGISYDECIDDQATDMSNNFGERLWPARLPPGILVVDGKDPLISRWDVVLSEEKPKDLVRTARLPDMKSEFARLALWAELVRRQHGKIWLEKTTEKGVASCVSYALVFQLKDIDQVIKHVEPEGAERLMGLEYVADDQSESRKSTREEDARGTGTEKRVRLGVIAGAGQAGNFVKPSVSKQEVLDCSYDGLCFVFRASCAEADAKPGTSSWPARKVSIEDTVALDAVAGSRTHATSHDAPHVPTFTASNGRRDEIAAKLDDRIEGTRDRSHHRSLISELFLWEFPAGLSKDGDSSTIDDDYDDDDDLKDTFNTDLQSRTSEGSIEEKQTIVDFWLSLRDGPAEPHLIALKDCVDFDDFLDQVLRDPLQSVVLDVEPVRAFRLKVVSQPGAEAMWVRLTHKRAADVLSEVHAADSDGIGFSVALPVRVSAAISAQLSMPFRCYRTRA